MTLESLLQMCMYPILMVMIHKKSKSTILVLVDRGGKLGYLRHGYADLVADAHTVAEETRV
jgi:hypothetical protein